VVLFVLLAVWTLINVISDVFFYVALLVSSFNGFVGFGYAFVAGRGSVVEVT
jgi:hypothetical protein